MEIVSRKYKTIEEIEVDEVLYKYRNFENVNHISMLSDLEIFFAAPTSFEDKLDCKIPIRYELLTNQQIFEKYLSDSYERNPKFTRRQHREWAKGWARKSPIKNKARLLKFRDDEFNEYDKRLGILSLTANNSSSEMWNKYSNNQTGFCVGFHTKALFKFLGGGGPVQYVDELPTIKPTPWHSFDEQRYLREFSKLRYWEFEEEYRTMIFGKDGLDADSRKRKLTADVYKEIIIGDKITNENKTKIEAIMKETLPNVIIRRQKISDNKIVIE
jgi:hypothetical protein